MSEGYIAFRFKFNEWLQTLDKDQLIMVVNDCIDKFESGTFPTAEEEDW